MPAAIALLDCNNFYAACERSVNPELHGKPVAVLSSNDGCIIARSDEVKALGVPMGAPLFQWRDFLRRNQVAVLSANFQLYAEISARVMIEVMRELPGVEVYSIDEAFLDFDPVPEPQYESFAAQLRARLLRELDIPVSIGIAPNKLLAKMANRVAKKRKTNFVHVLRTPADWTPLLHQTPVGELWGVGRQLAQRFRRAGIHTAWELSQVPDHRRDLLHSVVERQLAHELRGAARKPLAAADSAAILAVLDHQHNAGRFPTVHASKKQIATSRSFGRPVTELAEMAEAVAWFTANAARKLRSQRSVASHLYLYLRTNRFKADYRHLDGAIALSQPTDFTPDLQRAALQLLRRIFRPGVPFNKAGVELGGITPAHGIQASLFQQPADRLRQMRLNHVVDRLNTQLGDEVLYWGRGTRFVPGPWPRAPRPWVPLSQHRNRHLREPKALQAEAVSVARPWW